MDALGSHATDGMQPRSVTRSPDSPLLRPQPGLYCCGNRKLRGVELTSAVPTKPSGNPSEYTVFWSKSRNLVAAGKLSMILSSMDVSAPSARRWVLHRVCSQAHMFTLYSSMTRSANSAMSSLQPTAHSSAVSSGALFMTNAADDPRCR